MWAHTDLRSKERYLQRQQWLQQWDYIITAPTFYINQKVRLFWSNQLAHVHELGIQRRESAATATTATVRLYHIIIVSFSPRKECSMRYLNNSIKPISSGKVGLPKLLEWKSVVKKRLVYLLMLLS